MGMTMTQKILAAHAGLPEVKAGQLIEAKLDLCLGNDITSPVAINEFERCGACGVFDRSRVALVMDHFTPNKDIKAAEQVKRVRGFADKYDVENFFDVGRMGVRARDYAGKMGWSAPASCIIGCRQPPHAPTARSAAFSTGVGSTDLAAGMAHRYLRGSRLPSAAENRADRQARPLRQRQGRDSRPDRPHRGGRRAVPLAGVHRSGCREFVDGRPAVHRQYGD